MIGLTWCPNWAVIQRDVVVLVVAAAVMGVGVAIIYGLPPVHDAARRRYAGYDLACERIAPYGFHAFAVVMGSLIVAAFLFLLGSGIFFLIKRYFPC